MRAKIKEREQAVELRKKGKSLKEIVREINVAKSSVSNWVRHIKLTGHQQTILDARKREVGQQTCNANSKRLQLAGLQSRKEFQKQGRLDASQEDIGHMQTCMLYWAEGGKDRHAVRIGNTDPHLLKVVVRCLKKFFDISDDRFHLCIRAYKDNGIHGDKIIQFWTRALGLSPDVASVTVRFDGDKRPRSGKRKKKHPYGVCEIGVYSTEIVQRIYGAIQEYIGFENPSWIT
jgi:hypothetical protein